MRLLLRFNHLCRWIKLAECSVACQMSLKFPLPFATAIAHAKKISLQG
jgi:hypothetical protein